MINPVLKRIIFQNPEIDEGRGSSCKFDHRRSNLIKSDNTEPLLRMYFETRQDEEADQTMQCTAAVETHIRGGR